MTTGFAILLLVPFAVFAAAMTNVPATLGAKMDGLSEETRMTVFLTSALVVMAIAAQLAGALPLA